MDASEILSKIIQQEIDKDIVTELLEQANFSSEDSEKILSKMRERESNYIYRHIHDMTNENIHKIKNDET